MIEIAIPGGDPLLLAHALLDFNGTLAQDGMLIEGVAERLRSLATRLQIHVVTADTAGTAASALAGLPLSLAIKLAGAAYLIWLAMAGGVIAVNDTVVAAMSRAKLAEKMYFRIKAIRVVLRLSRYANSCLLYAAKPCRHPCLAIR